MLNKRMSFALRNGMLILFCIAVIGFALTYFIKIPDKLSGQIVLSTDNPPKAIVTKIRGRIVTLLVKDKDAVEKDQIIAVMESLADTVEVNSLEKKLKEIDSMLAENLFSEFKSISFTDFYQLGELQNQFEQFKRAKNELSFGISEQAYSAERVIAENRLKALNAELENQNNQLIICQRDFDISNENFQNSQKLYSKDVISKSDLKEVESLKLAKELSVSQLKSQIISTQSKENDLKEQLIQLNKTVEIERNNFVESFYNLKAMIREWKETHFVKAPESGEISFAYPMSQNENVEQGATLCYIIPGKSILVGRLKVNQINFGKAEVGQRVKIKFDGYNYQEFGIVDGVVTSISEIPVENTYIISVGFPAALTTSYHKQIQFKYGLTGVADVIVSDKRLLDKLVFDKVRGSL